MGGVDIVEEVGRVRRIEVGRLGRVNRAAAPHGDEGIDFFVDGELRRPAKAGLRRFDADIVVQDKIDVAGAAGFDDDCAGRQIDEGRVDDEHHPADP